MRSVSDHVDEKADRVNEKVDHVDEKADRAAEVSARVDENADLGDLIAVSRDMMPEPPKGAWDLVDVIGCSVDEERARVDEKRARGGMADDDCVIGRDGDGEGRCLALRR